MKPDERKLIQKIVELTALIQEKYPELLNELAEYSFYTGGEEEQLKMLEHPEVNYRSLSSYLDSLKEVLKKYIKEKGKKDLYVIDHL